MHIYLLYNLQFEFEENLIIIDNKNKELPKLIQQSNGVRSNISSISTSTFAAQTRKGKKVILFSTEFAPTNPYPH